MVNVVVCIKHVPDTESKIKLKDGDKNVDTSGFKYIISPYDEYALEEGIRIKEKHGGTVTVITAGPKRSEEILRTAIAVGADNAVHVLADEDNPLKLAMSLGEIIKKNFQFDLILTGKEATDNNSSVFPSALAEYLGINDLNSVVRLEINGGTVTATRQIEGGDESISAKFPVVVSAQKGLNTPRYPTLPNILKARKKELKIFDIKSIAVPAMVTGGEFVGLSVPMPRKGAKIIEGATPEEIAAKLVRSLKEEAKVL